MIFKEASAECYVYITLPRETSSVTAGRFVLERALQPLDLSAFDVDEPLVDPGRRLRLLAVENGHILPTSDCRH